MQKFLYEKYEMKERGRIFTGFVQVLAEDSEQALDKARAKVGEDIFLCPIWTPQYQY